MLRNLLAYTLALVLLVACNGQPAGTANGAANPARALSSATGDPIAGRLVYERQGCAACHSTGTEQSVGPGLAGLFSAEGPALPPGVDYQGNLPNGQPHTDEAVAALIRSGVRGKIGFMMGRDISDADMADLLAYLRTLE
jgi:cytochrome c